VNRPLAVRFLLLKHLWKLRAHVPSERYAEITRSLTVQSSAAGFVARWKSGGKAREYEIPSRGLSLYARGDTAEPPGSDADDERTEGTARTFARHALGLSEAAAPPPSVARRVPWAVVGPVVALIAGGLAGGRALAPATAVLLFATLGEVWAPGGLFLLTGTGFLLALVGPPGFAATWNLVVSVLQFLSPYPRGRAVRSLGNLVAGVIAVGPAMSSARVPDPAGLALCLVAIVLATARSSYGSHRRLMPLALLLSFGVLAIEGWVVPAAVSLAVLAAELVILARAGGSPID